MSMSIHLAPLPVGGGERRRRAAIDTLCADIARFSARRSSWWGGLIAVGIVLLVPLALVDVPPLLDYPNHMARMYVLAFGQSDPILSQMYAPHWSIIPNLALDLLIPPLLHAGVPLDIAGRGAIALAILLPVLGCVALHRAVFGVRAYWPLLSGMAAYNVALRLGLLNFLIAVGLALLVTAGWIAWRDRRPAAAVAVTVAGALAVFLCHIMGVALLMLLLGCHEAWAVWRGRRTHGVLGRTVLWRGAALAAVFAAPCLLFLRAQVSQTSTGTQWQSFDFKLIGAFGAFIADRGALDLAVGLACYGSVYVCLRERRGGFAGGMAAVAAVLALGYAIAPLYFKGSGFFSTRFAVMFGFVVFAGFHPRDLPPRLAVLAAATFGVLFCVRMIDISVAWRAHGQDLTEIRETVASVPPGSRVLLSVVTYREAPNYWAQAPTARWIPFTFQSDLHEAALLVNERHAFYPPLFTNPDQQPLIVLPPYRALATPAARAGALLCAGGRPRPIGRFTVPGSCRLAHPVRLPAVAGRRRGARPRRLGR